MLQVFLLLSIGLCQVAYGVHHKASLHSALTVSSSISQEGSSDIISQSKKNLEWYNLLNNNVDPRIELNPYESLISTSRSEVYAGVGQSLESSGLQELNFKFVQSEQKLCFGIIEDKNVDFEALAHSLDFAQTLCSDGLPRGLHTIIPGQIAIGDTINLSVDRENKQVHFLKNEGDGLWSAGYENENSTYIVFELYGPGSMKVDGVVTANQSVLQSIPEEQETREEDEVTKQEVLETVPEINNQSAQDETNHDSDVVPDTIKEQETQEEKEISEQEVPETNQIAQDEADDGFDAVLEEVSEELAGDLNRTAKKTDSENAEVSEVSEEQ